MQPESDNEHKMGFWERLLEFHKDALGYELSKEVAVAYGIIFMFSMVIALFVTGGR